MIGEARYKRKLRRKRWLVRALIVIAVLVVAGTVFKLIGRDTPARTESNNGLQGESAAPKLPESVSGRYLFSGTIVIARAVERAARSGNGYDYNQPFSGLDSFGPEKYDAWAADLECPVTNNTVSYEQQVANLIFNCRPEFLPAMKKYITIVSLANNHTSDMGADGFDETQQLVNNAGIQTYGNYDPSVERDACEMIALPVRVTQADGSETKGTLPVAFCAWHYFFRNPLPGELDVMERYAERLPVFGFMHAGVEYVAQAGADQQNLAHRIIDGGAEFVIGNSPHWVQQSEVYKGKPIFYSTGNFIFDQLDYETQRGLSVDVSLSVTYDENVAKWLALGEQCAALDDNCLEEAEKQNLQKFEVNLTYAPVGSSGGNKKITQKANSTLQAAIEDRLDWANTKQVLSD